MAEETQISTPDESVELDTSSDVEPSEVLEDTSIEEPSQGDESAEIETKEQIQEQEQKLYAGKYKTVEDLEKGYSELQPFINKANDFEKKYNDLIKAQELEAQKHQQELLTLAQQKGFNTIEEQEIAQKVQIAELEYYAQNLNQISDPQLLGEVQQLLGAYVQTGHPQYLNAAKSYFSSNFIEKVADAKSDLARRLQGEYETKRSQERAKADEELANALRADFSEFLADVGANEGKAQALKSFCDAGFIQSKEDMQVFQEIYGKIAKFEREAYLKEIEAQKAIEETKNKAVISGGNSKTILDGGLKDSYTAEEIGRMSQAQYDALCDKYGELEITKRIK